jgi:L-ribulose-5-phosphate 3-epimerase UlaE
MAKEEEVKNQEAAPYKVEEKQLGAVPSIDESLNSLAKAGGFDFIEAIVDGTDNLNPQRKAKKKYFSHRQ